jgi:hypothetical protein
MIYLKYMRGYTQDTHRFYANTILFTYLEILRLEGGKGEYGQVLEPTFHGYQRDDCTAVVFSSHPCGIWSDF